MSDSPDTFTRRRVLAAAGGLLIPSACTRREEPKAPPPLKVPTAPPGADWLLTPGAPPPDWSLLDAWQRRITRADFTRLLEGVLTDGTSWFSHVEVCETEAIIRTATPRENAPRYVIQFAEAAVTDGPRYWRRRDELPPPADPARPLAGVHIALDPGHIGGAWAQMEERWFQPEGAPPVKEGELTLRTARVLAPLLEALGARVSHVRTRPEPLATVRPAQLVDAARASLVQEGRTVTPEAVRRESERLFYRAAEIRARGTLVNHTLRPDLVLCLHFNGDNWGDPAKAVFSPHNHLHILAHGCIGGGEFLLDDQRLEGLLRLVQRVPDEELPLCTAIARRMAEATALPAYQYLGGNARAVPGEPYVWMRNLLANRIYQCPVVFLEPYIMNNAEVCECLHAGDYTGTATVAGKERPSIFREYAQGVANGLRDYYAVRA